MKVLSRINIAFLCAASAVALTNAAFAQAGGGTEGVEAVTVTGSRVISDITNSPTPLTVVTSDQLQATTPTNIPDALNKLPVFLGSNSQRTSSNDKTNAAGNVLNLRNFGANRMLVLLDGHRVTPSNFDGTVDTDVLPQMLVQRVDVVTGGASAVYGSDAVTGVANFVLDKNFSGFKYQANAGISKYGDAASYQAGVAVGTDLFGGRGHFEGSVRFYHQDKVPQLARPYGSGGQAWALVGNGTAKNPFVNIKYGRMLLQGSPGGRVTCTCSANDTRFVSTGVLGPYYEGTPTGTANVNNGGDGGGYFPTSSFQASLRTAEAFGRFSYDIDDNVQAYVNLIASESGNMADWSATTINPGKGRGNIFYTNNPYLPAAAQAALQAGNPGNTFMMTDFFDYIGDKTALETGDDFRTGAVDRNLSATGGLSGNLLNRYTWDLYYTHGESRQEVYTPNNENVEKFLAGEDAVIDPSSGKVVCHISLTAYASRFPGCVPINPFGAHSITQEMFNWYTDRTSYVASNILDDVGGSITGDLFQLPAGAVRGALSAEARWQTLGVESAFDPAIFPDCTGLRLCTPSAALHDQPVLAPVTASDDVYEFAAEANVPILKDLPLIQSLSADLAGRYTDYSTSGVAETWKIGLDYHVNDTIRFRGTASVDIRAPNLYDLYAPLGIATAGFIDNLTGGNFNIIQRSSGNPNLTPEVAHTHTVGVVLTPDFLPGFTASVDYFRINMSNAITTINGSTSNIQNLCIASGGTSPYCSLVNRPFPYTNTTLANFPTSYSIESFNSAKVFTEGSDIELDYSFEMADLVSDVPGSVALRNMTSYQPHITTTAYPGASPTFTAMPKTRNTTFISYNLGSWGFNLQDTWFSGFTQVTAPGQVYVQPHLHSFNTTDVTIDKQLVSDSNALDLYFSVQNLFNAQPDILAAHSTATGLTYPVLKSENAMGRYFMIGIRGAL
jgi:outer membrane receptor protein involved in Fe transport